MAVLKSKSWGGYLKGCRELETFGKIDDPNTMEAYLEDARGLTRAVLKANKVSKSRSCFISIPPDFGADILFCYSYLSSQDTCNILIGYILQAFFCTAATCRSPMFYAEDKNTKEPKFWFPAETIVFDKAGTLQRPHLMLPIISFIEAAQLLLAGDPFQLPGLILNKATRSLWPDCFLQQVRIVPMLSNVLI